MCAHTHAYVTVYTYLCTRICAYICGPVNEMHMFLLCVCRGVTYMYVVFIHGCVYVYISS